MNENTKKIINELCELDPDLKKHEEKLAVIVERFLVSKPDTKFDAEFAKELKNKILSEPLPVKKVFGGSRLSIFNMNRNYFILSGATLAVVVLAVVLTQKGPALQKSNLASSSKSNITRIAAGAFGSLTVQGGGGSAGSQEIATKNASAIPQVAFGRGGGGGGAPSVSMTASAATGVTSDAIAVPAPDAKMMIYRPYRLQYVYKGDKLELNDKNLDVMRRVKPELNTNDAVSVLNKLGFGGINLGSFANTKLTIFELSQADSKGYITNVDLRNGNISISQNYSTNPCPKGICPVYVPLRPSDLLSDDALVSLSKEFLKNHGVDVSNYGEPVVQNDWRKNLETASPNFAPYIPDVISVLYPQKVNGISVYELGGTPSGLTVNVDVRNKQVNGAWNITNQNYEASSYEAETDSAKILKIAENGGIYGFGYMDPNAEVVQIELGTPKRILTTTWKPDGSGEVIVPALYFPVVNTPKGNQYYVQNAIVIPLVKELLQIPEPGPIQIMKGAPEPAVLNTPKGL